MLITIPKQTVNGEFKMTTVINPATTFTGFEATTIRLPNGQKIEGTKVYTVDKGFFKMICKVEDFASAMQHVLTTNTPATVPALTAGPSKVITAPVKATVKVLKA